MLDGNSWVSCEIQNGVTFMSLLYNSTQVDLIMYS